VFPLPPPFLIPPLVRECWPLIFIHQFNHVIIISRLLFGRCKFHKQVLNRLKCLAPSIIPISISLALLSGWSHILLNDLISGWKWFVGDWRQPLKWIVWLSGGGFLAIWGALELLLSQWFLFCHLLGCQGSGLMNFPLIRLTVSGCARPKILLTKCKLVSTLLVLRCSVKSPWSCWQF